MNVSKSGRIRKKPCKLTDFELKGFGTESQPSMISHDSAFKKPKLSEISQNDSGYKCIVCNIALFGLKEVIAHVLTLHCSKGEYCCTLCNTELNSSISVKRHIKSVHFECNVAFTCSMCKKAFQTKNRLKIHIKKHHGGKKSLLKSNFKKSMTQPTSSNSIAIDESLTCHICHKVSYFPLKR